MKRFVLMAVGVFTLSVIATESGIGMHSGERISVHYDTEYAGPLLKAFAHYLEKRIAEHPWSQDGGAARLEGKWGIFVNPTVAPRKEQRHLIVFIIRDEEGNRPILIAKLSYWQYLNFIDVTAAVAEKIIAVLREQSREAQAADR